MDSVIKTTLHNFQENYDQLMDTVARENKVLLIEREDGPNGVIVSPERWKEYEESVQRIEYKGIKLSSNSTYDK